MTKRRIAIKTPSMWTHGARITDYDSYTETPYPDDIDTEHDGYVYLITENGERRFMNRADYEKWEAGIFTNKEPLTIPWQKITTANIDALVK